MGGKSGKGGLPSRGGKVKSRIFSVWDLGIKGENDDWKMIGRESKERGIQESKRGEDPRESQRE